MHSAIATQATVNSWTTTDQCLNYLGRLHDSLEDYWGGYAAASAAAYAEAWNTQATVLAKTKANIAATKARNELIASFALSLLTVGVGGPLAGCLVKKGLTKLATSATKEFVDKAVSFAEEKIKEPIKGGTEFLVKHWGSEAAEDAFAPQGVNPNKYAPLMTESILARLRLLDDAVNALANQPTVTVDGCKNLITRINMHPFVQKMPDGSLDSDTLTPKAKIALWIAWGWARDKAYWRTHSHDAIYNEENMDFEPIMNELLTIGVPYLAVQQVASRKLIGNEIFTGKKIINMDGFIQWCLSNFIMVPLFSGLKSKPEWMEMVLNALIVRRITFAVTGV